MRNFEYLLYSTFSLILLFVLVLLPLAPVFASEDSLVPDVLEQQPQAADITLEGGLESHTEGVVNDPQVEAPVAAEAQIDSPQVIIDSDLDDAANNTTAQTSTSGPFDAETELINSPETISETSTEANDSPTIETDITLNSLSPEAETPIVLVSTTSEAVPDPVVETQNPSPTTPTSDTLELMASSSTSETLNQPQQVVGETASATVTNDENRFTFAKSECTTVGEGTFYCEKATLEPIVIHNDRVFAALDVEGDKEIYIEKNSVLTQITNNQFDDDAPYYDQLSNTLVWHRLIDGRYQIMSYDISSVKETQVTFDRYNNMEPNRYGDATVWQGWVGSDWEIFLLEGDELTMLTDNTTNDIAPSINGNHIVWQSFESGSWKMKVYDTRTKVTETIGDADGGSVENPRFVLVYDTKKDTGDTETKGYNLESGETITLGAKPVSVPKEIPDPDQTKEKRALISPSAQPKTKVDGSDDDDSIDTATGTTETRTNDVVVPPLDTENSGSSTTRSISNSTTTVDENSIVIPPLQTEATSSVDHIHDLIITPYVEPIENLSDSSQVPVASSS